DFFNYLLKNRIRPQVHYIPVYLQPYYKTLGFKKGLCCNAEEFYKREISLPIYPSLKNEDLRHVLDTIKRYFRRR
ncbi:MAG: DegT/DnrJ/EryC1/StrS family aminotransferase, partial [Candidatus Omnitrophica bacterium]|nr:DegT/DnrJ/EryC1/StrS family aminotransferase [Candidatus Omnitrophota bacterium]